MRNLLASEDIYNGGKVEAVLTGNGDILITEIDKHDHCESVLISKRFLEALLRQFPEFGESKKIPYGTFLDDADPEVWTR
jgi:hypothetical protein